MKTLVKAISAATALAAVVSAQAETSANVTVSNNYIWRGLTQTTDEPAISGGIDYASDSGFYAGTWVSNVQYASDDAFSYEHDLYLGYSGEAGSVSYDFGYLYYNYNEGTGFDFGEIYGTVGVGGASVSLYLLANTEAEESDFDDEDGDEADFGFGSAYYISADYGFDLNDDWSMGLHIGYHDGDFVHAFNFGDGETFDYTDYNVSFSKDAFTFLISGTDLETSGADALNNDDTKFVVSYSFEL